MSVVGLSKNALGQLVARIKGGSDILIPPSGFQHDRVYAANNTYNFVSGNTVGTSASIVSRAYGNGKIIQTDASALKVTALKRCVVSIDWRMLLTTQDAHVYLAKNGGATGDAIAFGCPAYAANKESLVSASVILEKGDTINMCIDAGDKVNVATVVHFNAIARQAQ